MRFISDVQLAQMDRVADLGLVEGLITKQVIVNTTVADGVAQAYDDDPGEGIAGLVKPLALEEVPDGLRQNDKSYVRVRVKRSCTLDLGEVFRIGVIYYRVILVQSDPGGQVQGKYLDCVEVEAL